MNLSYLTLLASLIIFLANISIDLNASNCFKIVIVNKVFVHKHDPTFIQKWLFVLLSSRCLCALVHRTTPGLTVITTTGFVIIKLIIKVPSSLTGGVHREYVLKCAYHNPDMIL